MKNTNITGTTNYNQLVTLKEFMNYLGVKDRRCGRKHYSNYLAALGKADNLPLLRTDIQRLDGNCI